MSVIWTKMGGLFALMEDFKGLVSRAEDEWKSRLVSKRIVHGGHVGSTKSSKNIK